MQFTLEALPDRSWEAVSVGEPWNGWATPVVTREVLADVLSASGEPHEWRGDSVWLGTPKVDLQSGEHPEFWESVEPDSQGRYDLAQMGWMFVALD